MFGGPPLVRDRVFFAEQVGIFPDFRKTAESFKQGLPTVNTVFKSNRCLEAVDEIL
jgi:hypothetical protein